MQRRLAFLALLFFLLPLFVVAPVHSQEPDQEAALPQGFVYVGDIIPDALQDICYYGGNNFMGRPVEGYKAPVAILSQQAAVALKNVSDMCHGMDYGLKIFDAYRPQTAVNHFVRWAKDPQDTVNKALFYPNISKSKLFSLGYLSSKSGHSRGSTVDLTLMDLATGQELDMGTPFDFLDARSHYGAKGLTNEQIYNRSVLRAMMEKYGFKAHNKEWWHFTLINEPFPHTYFDFPVR